MARKPIIAGNWKMYNTRAQAAGLAKGLAEAVGKLTDVDVVLCPTYMSLDTVAAAILGTNIQLGAQNCHYKDEGAFTGEVAIPMLKEAGVTHIIVGHSERRQFYAEKDEKINEKAAAIHAAGLTPIVCVGEMLADRQAGKTAEVVTTQVRGCLAGLDPEKVAASVIAYEPVWAIGTGVTATKEQAQEAHAIIRKLVSEMFSASVAERVRIQYGGSVKPDNVAEIMAQPDVDGALVGGASLKVDSFAKIVKFQ